MTAKMPPDAGRLTEHEMLTNKTAKPTARCVACGGTLSLFGPRLQYEYHRCVECGTIQLYPLPSAAELARAYAARVRHCRTLRGRCRSVSHVRANVLSKHRLCAERLPRGRVSSWIMARAGAACASCSSQKASDVQGVEPSDRMAAHCRKKGLPVHHGDLSALQEQGRANRHIRAKHRVRTSRRA